MENTFATINGVQVEIGDFIGCRIVEDDCRLMRVSGIHFDADGIRINVADAAYQALTIKPQQFDGRVYLESEIEIDYRDRLWVVRR